MKRHPKLILLRLLLAIGVVYALPESHLRWGERYPWHDGQQAFGFIISFFIIGMGAALVFVFLGTLAQFLLRKRPARLTVFTDLGLFIVFSGLLVYGGVTARYSDSPPNNTRGYVKTPEKNFVNNQIFDMKRFDEIRWSKNEFS